MPDLDYVIIVGRFGIPIADGADLDDDPDMIWCDAGEISLEPLVAETKVVDGSPVPWTGGQSTFTPTIDAEGYSTWRGQHFIKTIDLTSTKVNPRIVDGKATHRVTFRNVKAGVLDVKFEQRSVRLSADMAEALDETAAAAYGLPTGTLVCDLTKLLPVPVANSVPIVIGPQGPAGPNSIPTDEFMAEKADDSTSEFGTAISRKLSRVSVPDYASGTFSFDPETSVYGSEFLMTNSREKFSTAAARGGTYKIAVIGDSLSSGYLTSQQYSWPALMSRSHLPSRNVEVRGERVNLTAMNGTVADPRLSYVGSWDFGQQTLGILSGAGSATATFTNPGTVAEVKVQGNAVSSYSIVIDGGAPVTVNVPGDFAEHVHTVSGLPDTVHTVQISWVSGSWSPASILCGYDTGIDVYNAGIAGSSSDDWTGAPTYQVYPAVTSAPDLVVISLLYGDFFAATSPADFKANLLTTIGLFPVGTDFLLVGEPRSSTVPVSGFEAYLTALYELANTGALPLLDLNHAWRNTDMDSLTGVDHLHLNDAGTSAFARAVTNAIAPSAPGVNRDAIDARALVVAAAKARVAVAPSVGTKTYDPLRNSYNLRPSHLRRWRAALANAAIGSGEARLACFGTSIAAGQGVTTIATESYPNQLRAMIATRAGVPVAGTGPVLCHLGDTTIDSRWTYSGTWSKFNPGPTNRTVLYSCTTNGGTATYTSDLAGTIAEFWFSQSSGAFSFTVDGSAPSSGVTVTGGTYSSGTVTPTNSTAIGKVSVTGLADTTHPIVVTRITSPLYLAAACVRKATGLSVGAIGSGGARLSDTSLSQPYDLRTFMNTSWAPHLVIADFMTNEAYTQVSAATFKTQLDAMCVSITNAGSDLILVGEIPAGGTDQGGAAMNLTAYRQALYEVADKYDLPVLDQFDRWGSYTSANGLGFMSDAFHPNKKGYRDYAAGVLPLVA